MGVELLEGGVAHPCLNPMQFWDECQSQGISVEPWFGRVNTFRYGLGAEPGHGYLLMVGGDLQDRQMNSPALALRFSSADQSELNEATIQRIVVLQARCLNPGDPVFDEDNPQPYEVEIADRRYLLRRVMIDQAYNMHRVECTTCPPSGGSGGTEGDLCIGDFYSDTLNAGAFWTWDTLGADLWDKVTGLNTAGDLGDWPGLPFDPQGTPIDFVYWQQPALDALEFFLRRVGCSLMYDPYEDTFDVVQLGAEDRDFTIVQQLRRDRLIHDDYTVEVDRARRAEKVRVLFRVVPPQAGKSPWYAVDNTDSTISSMTQATALETGTIVTIKDDMMAVWDMGSVVNTADLNARALERTKDYFRQLTQGKRLQQIYSGALSELLPGSQVFQVQLEDVGERVKTTIFRQFQYTNQQWREIHCWDCPTCGLSGSGQGSACQQTDQLLLESTQCIDGVPVKQCQLITFPFTVTVCQVTCDDTGSGV